MHKTLAPILATASLLSGYVLTAEADLGGPYAPDADTIALYHFDEAPGAADPGTPIANHGSGGAVLDLTDTGGPDGRDSDPASGHGYQAEACDARFGAAFDVRKSGNGSWVENIGDPRRADAGGLLTADAVPQSSLQGEDGAFTYEALALFSAQGREQQLIAHDGPDGKRGFLFYLKATGKLAFNDGRGSIDFELPSSGPHQFAADAWYHVAVTYSGERGTEGNLKCYWTRLDAGASEANLLGTATLATDLSSEADANRLGVGTTTREPFRFQPARIDEVRLSRVARGAQEFVFQRLPPKRIPIR